MSRMQFHEDKLEYTQTLSLSLSLSLSLYLAAGLTSILVTFAPVLAQTETPNICFFQDDGSCKPDETWDVEASSSVCDSDNFIEPRQLVVLDAWAFDHRMSWPVVSLPGVSWNEYDEKLYDKKIYERYFPSQAIAKLYFATLDPAAIVGHCTTAAVDCQEVDSASELEMAVLDMLAAARPQGCVGTPYKLGFARMRGDWDMAQMWYSRLAGLHAEPIYRHGGAQDALYYNARDMGDLDCGGAPCGYLCDHTVEGLLYMKGFDAVENWAYAAGNYPETENHIYMINTAQYLARQSLGLPGDYDDWWLGYNGRFDGQWAMHQGWLQRILRRDFNEFNAIPYSKMTFMALLNLFDFTDQGAHPQVKLGARVALDYVSARFALQSSNLRRVVPFHRRREVDHVKPEVNVWDQNGLAGYYAVLAGNYTTSRTDDATFTPAGDPVFDGHGDLFDVTTLVFGATTGYRVPDMLLDLMIEKEGNAYYMRVHQGQTNVWHYGGLDGPEFTEPYNGHFINSWSEPDVRNGPEIVYSEERFMISGGGKYRYNASWTESEENNSWAVRPIVVMPRNGGTRLEGFIRYPADQSARNPHDDNLSGIFENFACADRPLVVPDEMLGCVATEHVFDLPGSLLDAIEDSARLRVFDFTGGTCADFDYGIYLIAYERTQRLTPDTPECEWGFFEVVDEREVAGLGELLARFEVLNGDPSSFAWTNGVYTTTRGRTIGCDPTAADGWVISRIDDHVLASDERAFASWPFIETYAMARTFDEAGRVSTRPDESTKIMTADGTGLVVVNNPRRNESLIMSMADPTLLKSEGPVRFLQSCRAKDLVPGADIHPEDIARQMQLTGSTGGIWSFDPSRVKYVSLLWDACSDFEGLSVELEDVRTGAWRSASPFRVFTDDYVAPRYRTRTDIIVHEGDSVGGDRFDAIRVQYATSLGPDGDFCVLEDVDVFEYCPHPDPENGKGDCDGDHVLDEHDLCLNVRVDPLSTLGQDAFDSDGDGVADGLGWMGIDMGYGTLCDVCPAKPNPEQREVWERDTFGGDLDSDNIPDSCDLCPHLPGPFAWQAGMDDDGDGVACDCDNCTGANNPDQANCDEDLDPGDPGLYSSDVAGDACDPDPCIALLPSSVPEPAKVCNSGGYTYELLSVTETIDPVLVGFEPGEGDGARTEDVTHAFCNCTGYSTPEDCQSLYGGDCSEEPHPELDHDNIGPGWHYLNLDESMTFVPPATRGTVPRSFRKSGVSGSESSHPLDGTRNQTFVWDLLDDPEYAEGCSMYDCDDFDVYLYFHPKVDGFVTHETFHPSRPSEGWWRELGRKVCPYLHNPRIAEAEDARRGGGFYAHFDDASVPGETGDLLQGLGVFIPFWEYTDPAPAGRQNPFIRTSSLVTASATLLFDPAQGSFARVLGHVYDDVEDVLDARGGAAVMVGFAQLPGTDDLVVDGSADMATSRTIWLFGGEDRVQYRSDLWAGAVVATGDPDGDRVVWTRLLPQTGQAWPSPRAQSAMFHDPTTNSLVLWGGHDGQMVYDDLWYLDLDDMTWQEVVPQGWPPEGLVAMAYDHATLRSGQKGQVWPVPTGFIWGGMRADGTYSSDLFVLDLAHASFRRVLAGEDGPPGLMAAGLGVDRAGRTVYLSGGYDDITTHNWLWAMDLDRARWSLLQGDCLAGTCPYFSTGPAAVVDARTSLVSVIPGRSSVETVGVFAEPAFVHHHAGGWKGSHEWSGSGAAGDCDADGIPEEGAGLLCTSHPEWWNGPGTSLCDTLSGVLACDQAGTPASELGSRTVPGLGRMAVAGRTMFMLVADRLVSVDVSDALLPAALDSLYLGGKGRDLEIVSGDRIVVAADSGLVFVDVDQAGTMTRAARIPTCGRAVSVDVSGDDVYFLTPLGVGRAPLSGDPAVPELFSLVLPVSRWDFDLVPVDPGRCWVMSAIADAACRWFECPADGYRPLEAVGGALYFSALRHLMVVDASADVLELVADVGLDARVDEMRRHGTLIYANACDGGTEVIDVSASVSPVLLGEHSVAGWVDGLWASGESWFRQSGDVIEVAIEVQP